MKSSKPNTSKMDRRTFLASAAVAGAGATLSGGLARALAQGGAKPSDINVGLIGSGTQGQVLLRDALKIPGIRFKAICDIWSYSQRYGSGIVRKAKQGKPAVFVDYKEMLAKAKELDLDAVIVATPDWTHAEQANASMNVGLHVYSEKEMCNTLPLSASIVKTAAQTGRICQIGHQRRSSPVYQLAYELIHKHGICGRLTNCYGQWHRSVAQPRDWPKSPKYIMPEEVLAQYGYVDAAGKGSMLRFRNWRWYKKYAAGPIADLGSHQIDIFSWFLGAEPLSVLASGGGDYYGERDWYEDVMAVYEYKTKAGSARAFYEVLNTNGFGHYFERFMGDKGTITISEDPRKCYYAGEPGGKVPEWMAKLPGAPSQPLEAAGMIEAVRAGNIAEASKAMETFRAVSLIDALKAKPGGQAAAAEARKNPHRLHLENFFAAIRAGSKKGLACPPEVAYPTAVAVLTVNKAIKAGKRICFEAADYKA